MLYVFQAQVGSVSGQQQQTQKVLMSQGSTVLQTTHTPLTLAQKFGKFMYMDQKIYSSNNGHLGIVVFRSVVITYWLLQGVITKFLAFLN